MRWRAHQRRLRIDLATRRRAGCAPTMRFGRRDDMESHSAHRAWTDWGGYYATTPTRLIEQGYYAALDPAYWTEMYDEDAWDSPNDVHLAFCRASYVDDTYMCWLFDGYQDDGYTFLAGCTLSDCHGEATTWIQSPRIRGDIGVESP